jgi:hypothetical protein
MMTLLYISIGTSIGVPIGAFLAFRGSSTREEEEDERYRVVGLMLESLCERQATQEAQMRGLAQLLAERDTVIAQTTDRLDWETSKLAGMFLGSKLVLNAHSHDLADQAGRLKVLESRMGVVDFGSVVTLPEVLEITGEG